MSRTRTRGLSTLNQFCGPDKSGSEADESRGALTDLFGDLSDSIPGQIKDQKVLEAGDKMRNLQESGPVNLPLLDLTELDQTARQRLETREERSG